MARSVLWQWIVNRSRSAPITALVLALLGCEDTPHGAEEPAASATPVARHDVHIALPPSLRGLPVGPPDIHGNPSVVPCVTCHDGSPDASAPLPTVARGIAGPHVGLAVEHGTLTCGACHHPTDRAALRLADGRAIPLEEAMTLCTQCHGPQGRSYEHGAHGGMRGHWDLSRGPRTKNHCVACHDPHGPAFGSFMPMPGPRDRFMPAPRGADDHE